MDPQRKQKDRTGIREGPQPTDIDEKFMAFRRKQAGALRMREKADRELRDQQRAPQTLQQSLTVTPSLKSPSQPRSSAPQSQKRYASPQLLHRQQADADPESFSRLKITSSSSGPRTLSSKPKLFNPNTDPIPLRRMPEPDIITEPESSNMTRAQHNPRGAAPSRQLFDHRKHDPVHFLSRQQPSQPEKQQTPKINGDYISAGSTSSYANSISSSFTLSSTTDTSSASSALFDTHAHPPADDSTSNIFSQQLKRLYRQITTLEAKIQKEESEEVEEMNSRVVLKGKETNKLEREREKWAIKLEDHKRLSEVILNLLQLALNPSGPASLKDIPARYNIIVRLWTHGFYKLLESLRRSCHSSELALELLQEFIYYAYTFYAGLLEDRRLSNYRSGWLEALGDLARYRMIVAAMLDGNIKGNSGLTADAVRAVNELDSAGGLNVPNGTANGNTSGRKSISDIPEGLAASQTPSVGIVAARLLEVGPEKERWKNIARDWYASGILEQPGNGKLHHHLGFLCRESENEELRSVYHFLKSLTVFHPFGTSRESVLSVWSAAAQSRRMIPDAKVSDLFILLHGMIFTNIQLDDFQPTLARFLERLVIEGAEECDWVMMAIINITAVLEYGRNEVTLRKLGIPPGKDMTKETTSRTLAKKPQDDQTMDVDEESSRVPSIQPSENLLKEETPVSEHPLAFKGALQLTFSMLTYVLRNPMHKATSYSRSTVNPYLTVLLTFLSTVLKSETSHEILERSIPWEDLAAFFTTIPRKVMESQNLFTTVPGSRWELLSSGCVPPLPEDWCIRGLGWAGRKVYERGYWRTSEDRPELEVLEGSNTNQMTDGQIEDDTEESIQAKFKSGSNCGKPKPDGSGVSPNMVLNRRWIRVVRSAVDLSAAVPGFTWVEGTRDWRVEGKLEEKVAAWREMERMEREEEERRRMGRRWNDDEMDVDEEEVEESSEEDDPNDSEEVNELKARRRYLRKLLQYADRGQKSSTPRSSNTHRRRDDYPALHIVPGYSTLVIDTNILLSSLSMLATLIESLRWTVVIPLPVIMELDGLVNNTFQLGQAARSALDYITSHLRTHSKSLKVLTSKGNYLTNINVKTEEVDFTSGNFERNMDDLILKAAIWQDEHWMDRSSMLDSDCRDTNGAVKVVLLSLDRNLRLKARSRQLPAAGEKDLAVLLAKAS